MLSPAERLFRDEIREKKRAAIGVHSRKGKRGYVGKVLYTADILRGKEKRAYQKNGKVVSWNMYEEIMDYSMFEDLSFKQQQKVLMELRDKFPNSKIQHKWGLHNVAYYDLVKKLGLTGKGKYSNKTNGKKRVKFTDEELVKAMNEVIDKKTFLKLDDSQRFFLLNHYTEMIDSKDLCDIWGITSNTLYNYKWSLRKKDEAGELEEIDADSLKESVKHIEIKEEPSVEEVLNEPETNLVNGSSPKEEVAATQEPLETPKVEEKPVETVEEVQVVPEVEQSNRRYGTKLEFDGEYNKEQLKRKLLTLVELLEDDGRFYKMDISFTEIEED